MRELKQNWYDLFNGFKVALCLSKIGLAFLGLVLCFVGYSIITGVPVGYGWIVTTLIALVIIASLLGSAVLRGKSPKMALAVSAVLILFCVLNLLFWGTGREAYPQAVLCFEVGLFMLAVWAFFGGAIARIAAVEVASDERIGLKEAGAFACKHYKGFLLTVIAPLVAAGLLLLCVAFWGLVAAIPVLDIVLALLSPLCILAGIASAVIVIGLAFGSPLLFPALATEGSDAFDALSRTFGYVFIRPWRYVWYLLVAAAYGLVCLLVVKLFVIVSLMAVDRGAAVGFGLAGQGDKWDVVSHNALVYADVALKPIREVLGTQVETVKTWDFTGDGTPQGRGGYLSQFFAYTVAVPELPTAPKDLNEARQERIRRQYDQALNDFELEAEELGGTTADYDRLTREYDDIVRRLDSGAFGEGITREDLEARKKEIDAQKRRLSGQLSVLEDRKQVVLQAFANLKAAGATADAFRLEDLNRHGIDPTKAPEPSVDSAGENPWYYMPTSLILAVFLMIYFALVAGFAVSLKLSLFTITYLLMRRRLDGTDMTEVYRDEAVEEDYLEQTGETPVTGEAPAEQPSEESTEQPSEESSEEGESEEKSE